MSKGVVVARVIIVNCIHGDASHASMVSSRLSNSVVSLLNHQGDILKTYRIWDATDIPIFDINLWGQAMTVASFYVWFLARETAI